MYKIILLYLIILVERARLQNDEIITTIRLSNESSTTPSSAFNLTSENSENPIEKLIQSSSISIDKRKRENGNKNTKHSNGSIKRYRDTSESYPEKLQIPLTYNENFPEREENNYDNIKSLMEIKNDDENLETKETSTYFVNSSKRKHDENPIIISKHKDFHEKPLIYSPVILNYPPIYDVISRLNQLTSPTIMKNPYAMKYGEQNDPWDNQLYVSSTHNPELSILEGIIPRNKRYDCIRASVLDGENNCYYLKFIKTKCPDNDSDDESSEEKESREYDGNDQEGYDYEESNIRLDTMKPRSRYISNTRHNKIVEGTRNNNRMANRPKNKRKLVHVEYPGRSSNGKLYRDYSRLKEFRKPTLLYEGTSNDNDMTSNIKYYSPRDRVLSYVKNHRSNPSNIRTDNLVEGESQITKSNLGEDYSEKNTGEDNSNTIDSKYGNDIKLPVRIDPFGDSYTLTIPTVFFQDIIRKECSRCVPRKRNAIPTILTNNTSNDSQMKNTTQKSVNDN